MIKNCQFKTVKYLLSLILISFVFVLFFNTKVDAATSDNISFQGKIVRNDSGHEGMNVVTGTPACVLAGADTCDFKVSYYNASSGGTLQFSENFLDVEIGDYGGVFDLRLGTGTSVAGIYANISDTLSANTDIYLQVEFAPNGTTLTETFSRMPLASAGYAISAKTAALATSALGDLTGSGFIFHPISVAPTVVEGKVYYDSVDKKLKLYNGTAWIDVGTGSGTTVWTEENLTSLTYSQYMATTGIGTFGSFTVDTDESRVSINGSGSKSGLSVYSNFSGTPTYPVVTFMADHSSFAGTILDLKQDGTGKLLTGYKGSGLEFEFDNRGDLHLNTDGMLYFEKFDSAPTNYYPNAGEGCIYSVGTNIYWDPACNGSSSILNGGSALWSDAGLFSYLTSTTDDLIFGASTIADATFYFDVDASSGNYLEIDNAANSSRLFTIDSTGNVGIGVAVPSAKLDIGGASSVISNTSGNITITPASGILDVNGKIALSGTQVLYRPTTMTGSLIVGNGGNNLSHTTGAEGYYNTFVGLSAGISNTTGFLNTAQGHESFNSNTSGGYNSAFGGQSLKSNTTGTGNSAFGMQSLVANNTGSTNSAQGLYSLMSNTTGSYNSAFGAHSLYSNIGGSRNSGLGFDAGRLIADGTTANTTPSNSLFLGAETKALADSETNQIVIGYSAIGKGSNSVVLGNDSITSTYLKGSIWVSDGTAGAPAIRFVNDDNTGFYRGGADILTFVANGQSAMGIYGASGVGRLAIGNGTPVSRIQIFDDNNNTASGITFGGSSGTYMQLYKSASNKLSLTGGSLGIRAIPSIDFAVGDSDTGLKWISDGNLAVYTNNAERIRIASNGSVSISSSTAGATLNVGRFPNQPSIKSTADWLIMDSNTAPAALNYYSAQNVHLAYGGGNVGIGAISPSIDLAIRDADTGFESISAGNLAVYINNSEVMRWGSNNGVGIGVAPTTKFHVRTSTTTNDNITFDNGTSWMKILPGTLGGGSYNPVVKAGDMGIIFTNGTSGSGEFFIGGWSSYASGLRIRANYQNVVVQRSEANNADANTYLESLGAFHSTQGVAVAVFYEYYTDSTNVARSLSRTGGALDIAEWYGVGYESLNSYGISTLKKGDIVCIDDNEKEKVVACSSGNQKILGVVSTKPFMTMGDNRIAADRSQQVEVALAGMIPIVVTSKNGDIEMGDSLTISELPGVSQKATSNGEIVGKALETFKPSEMSCQNVSSLESIVWPADDGHNETRPCFRLPNGVYVGKVSMFLNIYRYDVYATSAVQELGVKIEDLKAQILAINTGNGTTLPLNADGILARMNIESNTLKITGDIEVLGKSTFKDIDVGVMALTGNSIAIKGTTCIDEEGKANLALCEVNTLYLQKDKSGNVNFFNGGIVLDPTGKITAGQLEIKEESQTIGSGTILTGQSSVVINSSKITTNSKIFVTARNNTNGQNIYVSAKTVGESFTVSIQQPITTDITFDWFVVNSVPVDNI